MAESSRMTGIIFSDLGQAAKFMGMPWVQDLLLDRLGFRPYPATLNLRPRDVQDAVVWDRARNVSRGMSLTVADGSHCGARLFRVEICGPGRDADDSVPGAVLLPEVKDYPQDKVEVVAPIGLKDHFGVRDGDALTLEFRT